METFDFSKAYFDSFLSGFYSAAYSMSIDLILGTLILIAVLIIILLVLLIKSINNIKELYRSTNNIPTDDTDLFHERELIDDIDEFTEDTLLVPETPGKDIDNDNREVTSYIDKVISINSELEPFGFAYDSDHGDFFSIMYPWQRQFGYCAFYDETAPALSLIFDSDPIYFDYNGKHWLIQFWKGQYGITTGAEIGVYNTKDDGLSIPGVFKGKFYRAVDDDERLKIGFSLVKNDELISSRSGIHWWLTSFILGEFSNPEELVMYIEIDFPNTNMRDAFINGLINVGYTNDDYSVVNNTIYVVFDTPYSRQPYTKTNFTEELMQSNNKRNVDLFNKATESFTDIIDKLYLLREESPDDFNKVIKIGKPKQLYEFYNSIKNYLN